MVAVLATVGTGGVGDTEKAARIAQLMKEAEEAAKAERIARAAIVVGTDIAEQLKNAYVIWKDKGFVEVVVGNTTLSAVITRRA